MTRLGYKLNQHYEIETLFGDTIFGKVIPMNKVPKKAFYVNGYMDKDCNQLTVYRTIQPNGSKKHYITVH